jgi:signal transduction histidine kinase
MTAGKPFTLPAEVVHELRTPLTSIRGFADVLAKGAEQLSADQRADYVQRIAAAAVRLDELITGLSEH